MHIYLRSFDIYCQKKSRDEYQHKKENIVYQSHEFSRTSVPDATHWGKSEN